MPEFDIFLLPTSTLATAALWSSETFSSPSWCCFDRLTASTAGEAKLPHGCGLSSIIHPSLFLAAHPAPSAGVGTRKMPEFGFFRIPSAADLSLQGHLLFPGRYLPIIPPLFLGSRSAMPGFPLDVFGGSLRALKLSCR